MVHMHLRLHIPCCLAKFLYTRLAYLSYTKNMNIEAFSQPDRYKRQRGGALVYIFLAVAMMGILTMTMMEPSGSNRPQMAYKLANELDAQIRFIRAAVEECVQMYPAGDPTIVNGTGGIDDDYLAPYPVAPDSTHFTGSTLGPAADNAAEHLRCPGNPGVDHNHEPLFGGASGRFFPKPAHPSLDTWYYLNSSDTIVGEVSEGVYLQFGTSSSEAFILDAFQMLEDRYNDCEFDYKIGTGTNGCASGRHCIRYWFHRVTPAC